MKYTKTEKIAKGWSSYIWIVKDKSGKKFVLKEVREKSNRKNLAEREGKMLQLANSVGIGPKVKEVNFEENFVVMEYINGEKLFDFVLEKEFDNITKKELYDFLKELIRQCLILDGIGLRHTQLQVGKNILVTKRKVKISPIILDFEKATITTSGKEKNFGQLTGFLLYNPHGKIAKKIRAKLKIKL
jgi:putative serine/threonine protein kinase